MIPRSEVERVLDSARAEDGLILLDPDLRLLAERAPLEGGHAAVIVLCIDGMHPTLGPIPFDARRA